MTKTDLKRKVKQALKQLQINRYIGHKSPHSIVIGLHRVKEASSTLMDSRIEHMRAAALEEMIAYLDSLKYNFMSLEECMREPKKRRIAITFDDGFRDVYTHAYPILRHYNIPFTVFLTTSTVESARLLWLHKLYLSLDRMSKAKWLELCHGFDPKITTTDAQSTILDHIIHNWDPALLTSIVSKMAREAGISKSEEMVMAQRLYLTQSQLYEMEKSGLTIEAHGHGHWSLPTLDRQQTCSEIGVCLEAIEREFGRRPAFYAPAFGKMSSYLYECAQKDKTIELVGTEAGVIKAGMARGYVPRLMTTNVLDLSFVLFRLYLRGNHRRR